MDEDLFGNSEISKRDFYGCGKCLLEILLNVCIYIIIFTILASKAFSLGYSYGQYLGNDITIQAEDNNDR